MWTTAHAYDPSTALWRAQVEQALADLAVSSPRTSSAPTPTLVPVRWAALGSGPAISCWGSATAAVRRTARRAVWIWIGSSSLCGQDRYAVSAPLTLEAVYRILTGQTRTTGVAIFEARAFLNALSAHIIQDWLTSAELRQRTTPGC
jgi:hypothetical protein